MHDLDFRTAYDVQRMTKDSAPAPATAPLSLFSTVLCALCRCLGASSVDCVIPRFAMSQRGLQWGRGRGRETVALLPIFNKLQLRIVDNNCCCCLLPRWVASACPRYPRSPCLAAVSVYCCKSLHKMPHMMSQSMSQSMPNATENVSCFCTKMKCGMRACWTCHRREEEPRSRKGKRINWNEKELITSCIKHWTIGGSLGAGTAVSAFRIVDN